MGLAYWVVVPYLVAYARFKFAAINKVNPAKPVASRARCHRHQSSRRSVQFEGGASPLQFITMALMGWFRKRVIKPLVTKHSTTATSSQSRAPPSRPSVAAAIVTRMVAAPRAGKTVFKVRIACCCTVIYEVASNRAGFRKSHTPNMVPTRRAASSRLTKSIINASIQYSFADIDSALLILIYFGLNTLSRENMMRKTEKREYDASSRKEAAQLTRQTIIEVARRVFLEKGYAAATMPAIAQAAGVALDTVYATVGKKPALFRLLIEMAISGSAGAVAPEEREYVRAIRAETDAAKKLRIYATAVRSIQEELAPLFRRLQGAASLDPELAELWQNISQRRAKNMRLLAANLAATGRLRRQLSVEKTADIIWSMNSPEFYLLLVEQRGWSSKEFEEWLGDAWIRLLLES